MNLPTSDADRQFLHDIGFRPLTFAYILPQEEEWYEAAKAQLGQTVFAEVWLSEREVELWTIHTPAEEETEYDFISPPQATD